MFSKTYADLMLKLLKLLGRQVVKLLGCRVSDLTTLKTKMEEKLNLLEVVGNFVVVKVVLVGHSGLFLYKVTI